MIITHVVLNVQQIHIPIKMFNNVNLAIIKFVKLVQHPHLLVLLVIIVNWLMRENVMMLLNVPMVLLLIVKMEFAKHVIPIVLLVQDLIITNVLLVLLIDIL